MDNEKGTEEDIEKDMEGLRSWERILWKLNKLCLPHISGSSQGAEHSRDSFMETR